MPADHKAHRSESSGAVHGVRNPALRHVLTHLITPLLMCVGMGLAYMGPSWRPSRTICRWRSSGRGPGRRCSPRQ